MLQVHYQVISSRLPEEPAIERYASFEIPALSLAVVYAIVQLARSNTNAF